MHSSIALAHMCPIIRLKGVRQCHLCPNGVAADAAAGTDADAAGAAGDDVADAAVFYPKSTVVSTSFNALCSQLIVVFKSFTRVDSRIMNTGTWYW